MQAFVRLAYAIELRIAMLAFNIYSGLKEQRTYWQRRLGTQGICIAMFA